MNACGTIQCVLGISFCLGGETDSLPGRLLWSSKGETVEQNSLME